MAAKSELPYDLVEEILARVPVKSLVRFRCVCKRWRSLLRDEGFIRKHMTYAPRKFLSLDNMCSISFEDDTMGNPKMILEPDLDRGEQNLFDVDIIGQCNGLFCISLYDKTSLALWNPSLRELRKIPTESIRTGFLMGFGYDHRMDDYKIVAIPPPPLQMTDNPQAQIITLKSNSWMIDCPSPLYSSFTSFSRGGTLLGKDIFWLVKKHNADTTYHILCFDLEAETFNDFQGPPAASRSRFLGPVVVNGSINVVNWLSDGSTIVWGADDHIKEEASRAKSWIKLFTLTMAKLKTPTLCLSFKAILRSTKTDDTELLVCAINGRDREEELLAYNVKRGTFRMFETDVHFPLRFHYLYEYMETLVPTCGL